MICASNNLRPNLELHHNTTGRQKQDQCVENLLTAEIHPAKLLPRHPSVTNCEPEGPSIGLSRTPARQARILCTHLCLAYIYFIGTSQCGQLRQIWTASRNGSTVSFHCLQQHMVELLTCYVFDQLFSTVSGVQAWMLTKNLSPSLFMYLVQVYPSL